MISIIPEDHSVVIDGQGTVGVNMDSVDPTIHAIQFDQVLGEGHLERIPDPLTGVIPPLEPIYSIEPWQAQVDEAEEIIYCFNNPKTYYITVQPRLGKPVLVYDKGWPQPPDTTDQQPPAQPTSNCVLYWSGTGFVWSAFPIDLDLSEAQAYVCNSVDQTAYGILQPSDWMVVRQNETGTPIPAGWSDWRQTIRDEALEKRLAVQGTESLEELDAYTQSTEYLTWTNPPA